MAEDQEIQYEIITEDKMVDLYRSAVDAYVKATNWTDSLFVDVSIPLELRPDRTVSILVFRKMGSGIGDLEDGTSVRINIDTLDAWREAN
jgi:hypothetical protein